MIANDELEGCGREWSVANFKDLSLSRIAGENHEKFNSE